MSIMATCPACETSYELADRLAGKKVRCKKCQEEFRVSAPLSPKKRATAEDDDIDEGIRADERRSVRANVPGRRPRLTADEEDEPLPRRRGRGDDDDDDSPISKRRVRKDAGGSGWILLIAGGGVVLLLLVAGVGFIFWRTAAGPDGAPKNAPGDPALPPQAGFVVKAPAVKVAAQAHEQKSERVILAGPGSHHAGVYFRTVVDGKLSSFLDLYDVPGAKQLGRTNLGELKGEMSLSLSPGGALLAVTEVLTENKKFESAVTIRSLSDGKVLQARWRPYPDGDIFKMLAWMTFVDDNRLLTLTKQRQVALWSLDGKAIYSVTHANPAKRFDDQRVDPYTKQPQNFAFSGDRGSLALASGGGFDVLDTATGKVRAKTAAFLTKDVTVKGLALNADGSRLAVYAWSVKGKDVREAISICDLKTNQLSGPFPLRISKEKETSNLGWSGNALSWWKADHLLVWGGNGNALVIEAATGQPVRELLGPRNGSFGFGDPDGRVWYEADSPGQVQPLLCAVDVPDAADRGLDEGHFKRWWLTQNGVESQAEAGDSRLGIFPRARPGH